MLTDLQQAVLFTATASHETWRKLRRGWAMEKHRELNREKIRTRAREHARLPSSRRLASEWAVKNPDRIRQSKKKYRGSERGRTRQREDRLRVLYGLTLSGFSERLSSQGGKCAICRAAPATDVDHNHTTGEVRELLCNNCNRGLGYFKESPGALRGALEYLSRHATP